LDGLLNHTLAFGEVEKMSQEMKSLHIAKHVFLQKVECDTWDEAVAALPDYSKEQTLSQFKLVRGKPLPENFKVGVHKSLY